MANYVNFFTENRTRKEALTIYNQRVEDAKIIYDKFSDTFLQRSCPYCLSDKFKPEEKFIDLYDVAKCSRCNSLYVNPVPSPEALQYYYNKCKCNLLLDDLFIKRGKKKSKNVVNNGKLNRVMDVIKNLNGSINILEIGCGSGSFLNLLDETLKQTDKKYSLYGVDLDENALNKNENKDIKFVVGNAETFEINEKFD